MHILYVEDNPVDADLLIRGFARTVPTWNIEWVDTLAKSYSKLEQHVAKQTTYDIVLTDMRLPDGNGVSLLSFLRERSISLPVVVLTGLGNEETVVTALKTGATDYVVKREDYLTRLPAVLETALGRYQIETARSQQRLTALYAEHNATDIDLTRRHFAAFAPHIHLNIVHTAEEVLMGLRPSKTGQATCDVLLFDYHLPGMNGLELLKEIREVHNLDVPVVFVTGNGDEEIALQALRLGAMDYVVKNNEYLHQLPLILENAFNRIQVRREQEALKASEEHFRSLIENSSDMIHVLNTNGEIRYTSPSVERLLGYSLEELKGKSCFDFIDPDDVSFARDTFANIMLRPGTVSPNIELHFRHKDGSWLYLEMVVKAVTKESGEVILITNARDITARKNAATELLRSYTRLKDTLAGTIQAMVATVEARDPYTAGHQKRVADLAVAIARKMCLSTDVVDSIYMAGTIHDLGKISIPAEILSTPRKLTSIEFSIIKTHSSVGYDILKDIEFPWPIAQMVLQHHERLDGSGYPLGLKEDETLIEAKILAVADVVEAISSNRPYRPALGIDIALDEIEKNKGILYDADAVRLCIKLFKEEGFAFE
jgi:PAS domain S-box-containing protein